MSPKGIAALERRIQKAKRLLVGLDFDGTLAPYAERPHLVKLPPRIKRLIERLARRPDTWVCIISGRLLEDVRRKAGIKGIHYGGNHGFELLGPRGRWTHPAAKRARKQLVALRLGRAEKLFPGAYYQDKRETLSLHYRMVPRRLWPEVERFVKVRFKTSRGLVLRRGNRVWEARPKVKWDKGLALERLAAELGRPEIFFAGDDVTDEEGIRSLGRRRITVRVGPGATQAVFRVARGQVGRTLRALADRPS